MENLRASMAEHRALLTLSMTKTMEATMQSRNRATSSPNLQRVGKSLVSNLTLWGIARAGSKHLRFTSSSSLKNPRSLSSRLLLHSRFTPNGRRAGQRQWLRPRRSRAEKSLGAYNKRLGRRTTIQGQWLRKRYLCIVGSSRCNKL